MNKPQKPKASILIVEDDSVIASVEEWRLKKMGYTVCGHAATGTDALALVTEKKPDLVLLDINLEGEMDGIEIAQVLDTQTDIPFIFLTAHVEDAILKRVKGTLHYGYIKKPFTDDDLRIAIELALSKSRFINRILSNNALYEMALDQYPLGVVITNNDGLILYLNNIARTITQSQAPSGTTHYWEVIKLEDSAQGKPLEDLWERVKKEEATLWFPENSVLIIPDKVQIPVAGNAAPLFNDKGGREGMVITLFALAEERKYFRVRL
jgi:CheY-like chemotaxis protein